MTIYPPMPDGPPKTPGAIKVRMLRFGRQGMGEGIPLGSPFPPNPINLVAGKRTLPGSDEIQIQYEPWYRQFRIRALDVNGAVIGERCIPESWAIYEPELV
jgi:hypothetical protein